MDFFLRQWRQYGRPFTWLRLTDKQASKLLNNNAEKLIDPDLRRKYNLDVVTNGCNVYEVMERDAKGKIKEKKLMARVLALSTFYADKGNGFFDKDFLNDPSMYYNCALDEFQREKGEKNTFDITYSFVNQLENLYRNTKSRIRVILIGNTLEEAADLLTLFNFIPESFGRYYLKKKRCVIDYIEPTEAYKNMRRGSIADILMPDASTFTNEVKSDNTLICKERLIKPQCVIKFTKDRSRWYTIWNGNIITEYNGEKISNIVSMRPYIDDAFQLDRRATVMLQFDQRNYRYRNLITFKKFQHELELLRPSK